MAKKPEKLVVHIYLKSRRTGKVYCDNKCDDIAVEFHNLWAVKKTVLCKKCVAVMKEKGLYD